MAGQRQREPAIHGADWEMDGRLKAAHDMVWVGTI